MYIDMDFCYALEFLLRSGIFLTYNEMFYAEFENHQVLPKAGLTY